jgi:predicted site-specific integrase-resolvase
MPFRMVYLSNLTGDFTMVRAGKRVALYCRVSTKDKGQTTENQRRALEQWAANAGCTVVATFEDKVSGAKGRDKRPQFDALLKAADRRKFDMIGSAGPVDVAPDRCP